MSGNNLPITLRVGVQWLIMFGVGWWQNNNNNDNNNNNNLEAVPGKHSIDSLQKTAILGTSHIIREVMQCEA